MVKDPNDTRTYDWVVGLAIELNQFNEKLGSALDAFETLHTMISEKVQEHGESQKATTSPSGSGNPTTEDKALTAPQLVSEEPSLSDTAIFDGPRKSKGNAPFF